MAKLFEEHKVSFICKPCLKSWTGESKRSDFTRHIENPHHNNHINNLLKKHSANKINNAFCYEERHLGFDKKDLYIKNGDENIQIHQCVRIGTLLEPELEDDSLM
tara:strand:- start:7130 stop:7444 length:315 start_codon:yes stop_codon:yes gene_type:complete